MRHALLVGAALVLLAAAPPPQHGTPVPLHPQPGTELDRAARALVADDLQNSAAHGEEPLLLLGTALLGPGHQALFVQLQSPRECGSAGCTTSVYVADHGTWTRVLDGTTGHLSVAQTRTRGMADLLTDDEHYVWTGTAYRGLQPAPAVDLRPRPARRR